MLRRAAVVVTRRTPAAVRPRRDPGIGEQRGGADAADAESVHLRLRLLVDGLARIHNIAVNADTTLTATYHPALGAGTGAFPAPDHARLALVAEHRQRGGAQGQQRARLGPSPSQRAASTRSRWPWANRATAPSTASSSAITRSARSPTAAASSPLGQPSRQRYQSGRVSSDLGGGDPLVVAVVPLEQVVGRGGGLGEPGQAAGLEGALQRAREDLTNVHSASAPRSSSAWRRPSSVSGTSVRPVWRPSRLHSVSPWRARTICGARREG